MGRANPTDPWSITLEVNPGSGMMDLGSVHKLAGDETSGADPWSIHKLAGDETCRMDLGSVGRVRDCTGSGPLIPGLSARNPMGG